VNKVSENLPQKKKIGMKGWEHGSSSRAPANKCEVLGSILSTTKRRGWEKEKIKQNKKTRKLLRKIQSKKYNSNHTNLFSHIGWHHLSPFLSPILLCNQDASSARKAKRRNQEGEFPGQVWNRTGPGNLIRKLTMW
jgi:hypothetical protein